VVKPKIKCRANISDIPSSCKEELHTSSQIGYEPRGRIYMQE
jgi:hypothetical protein